MTLPAAECSPAAKVLQELGYGQSPESHHNKDEASNDTPEPLHPPTMLPTTPLSMPTVHLEAQLQVKLLSVHGTIPAQATDGSAGYDLYSAVDRIILPRTRCAVPLDIAITPLPGTYAQILSWSGLSLKHHVDIKAETIDRNYTGNVQVILENAGDVPYSIKIGDRIAQMVILSHQTLVIVQVDTLGTTGRGSTGVNTSSQRTDMPMPNLDLPGVINNLDVTIKSPPPISETDLKPYDIYFCTNPFDNTMEIDVPIKGDHPTLGILSEYCDFRQ
jgi:dUTP pyrophosphatase